MFKKSLIALAVFLGTGSAHAIDVNITICAVQPINTGWVFIQPCGGWTSLSGGTNGWIKWDGTTPGGRMMYAEASKAEALGKVVKVRINPNAPTNNYDVTSMIRSLR